MARILPFSSGDYSGLPLFELPDDLLAGCNLNKGDVVTIDRNAPVENDDLATIETLDGRVYVLYVRFTDGAVSLFGTASTQPVLTLPLGGYKVLGAVDRKLTSLTQAQRHLSSSTSAAVATKP